jgi:hypothetical protein
LPYHCFVALESLVLKKIPPSPVTRFFIFIYVLI